MLGGRAAISYGLHVRGTTARIAAVAALLIGTSVASADVTRVAVVDADEVFLDALTTALEAWSIEVTTVSRPEGMDVVSAPDVASDADAGAIVWVSEVGGQHVLWVYDAEDQRVVARRIVAPPPFDEPTAASVALSVKTLLRHSAVAPTTERFGWTPPKESPFEVAPPEPVAPAPPNVFVEVTGGARFRTIGASDVEPTFGVAVSWSPRALRGRYSVHAGVRGSPGVALDTPGLIGSYRETTAHAGLGVAVPVRDRLSLAWALIYDLHYTRLDGLVLAVDQTAAESRFNPGLRGRMTAQLRVGEAELGLGLDAEHWLRGQRYTVFGEVVLETPDTVLSTIITLALPFR
jgi:hypothetical protein